MHICIDICIYTCTCVYMYTCIICDFPGDSVVKNLPVDARTQCMDMIPGLEDPLEESMATHPSTLVWRIPWREELGRL